MPFVPVRTRVSELLIISVLRTCSSYSSLTTVIALIHSLVDNCNVLVISDITVEHWPLYSFWQQASWSRWCTLLDNIALMGVGLFFYICAGHIYIQ